uniref:T. brucei spp.-specific protein n=1 Tax=Steinernema glaseri TaxID=37863 RepID=A0A1I8A0G1_9BILA
MKEIGGERTPCFLGFFVTRVFMWILLIFVDCSQWSSALEERLSVRLSHQVCNSCSQHLQIGDMMGPSQSRSPKGRSFSGDKDESLLFFGFLGLCSRHLCGKVSTAVAPTCGDAVRNPCKESRSSKPIALVLNYGSVNRRICHHIWSLSNSASCISLTTSHSLLSGSSPNAAPTPQLRRSPRPFPLHAPHSDQGAPYPSTVMPFFSQAVRPRWNRFRDEVSFCFFLLRDLRGQLAHLLTEMYSYVARRRSPGGQSPEERRGERADRYSAGGTRLAPKKPVETTTVFFSARRSRRFFLAEENKRRANSAPYGEGLERRTPRGKDEKMSWTEELLTEESWTQKLEELEQMLSG